jgi:hypothetical protein
MTSKQKTRVNDLKKDNHIQINNDSVISNRHPQPFEHKNRKRDSSFDGSTQVMTEELYAKIALRTIIFHIFLQILTTIFTTLVIFFIEVSFLNYSDTLMVRFILNFYSGTMLIFFLIVGNFFLKDIGNSPTWSLLYNLSFGNSLGFFLFSLGNEIIGHCVCFYFGVLTIMGIFFISTYALQEIIFWKIFLISTLPCLLYSILIYFYYKNFVLVLLLDLAYLYFSFTVIIFGLLLISYESQNYEGVHPALASFQYSVNAPWFILKLIILICSEEYEKSPKKINWR